MNRREFTTVLAAAPIAGRIKVSSPGEEGSVFLKYDGYDPGPSGGPGHMVRPDKLPEPAIEVTHKTPGSSSSSTKARPSR